MKKNICKFVTHRSDEKLEVYNFIYETDADIISEKQKSERNRLFLIKKGRGEFFADEKKYSFESGNVVFSFENEEFLFVPEKECEYLYISFSGSRANTLFYSFGINKVNRIFEGFDGLIPLWHNCLHMASETNLDLVAESMLLYAFSLFDKNVGKRDDIINQIIEITEENFTSCDLSISVVAEELCYNPKYISHIFKQKMGVGYSEYLRTKRIKYAVTLLEHGIDSVKNVALLSGFSDPLYFSSVFKKTVGVSPKDYRKK